MAGTPWQMRGMLAKHARKTGLQWGRMPHNLGSVRTYLFRASMTHELKIALAQLNPTVGDIAGNVALLRKRARDRGRQGRRPGGLRRAGAVRLPAGGPGAEAGVPAGLQVRRSRSWRPIPPMAARRCWSARPWLRGRHAAQRPVLLLDGARSPPAASSTSCRTTACSTRSACSRPGRCRGRSASSGVRLGLPICEDLWFCDVAECLAESGAEILLCPNGSPFEIDKMDQRIEHRGRAPAGDQSADHLCQPGRRAGRAGVRRRLVRAGSRAADHVPAADVPRGDRADALAPHQ